MQLIECVPNFSEGRNPQVIKEIAQSISRVSGAHLLHVDTGHSANRTVMTIAGEPQAVLEAVFKAAQTAASLIDMRFHKGNHPRIGALDVCPLIPLQGVTMDECIDFSKHLASRIGLELGIPVYLYAESQVTPSRKKLSYLRKGAYEALERRIKEQCFLPDYGPHDFNAGSGATIVGARNLLIAYNINLDTPLISKSKPITQTIRQTRDSVLVSPAILSSTYTWQECSAFVWYVEEYQCCQVSMNLINLKKTSLLDAFLGVKELAAQVGVQVTGSQIIGLVPLQAIIEVGQHVLNAAYKSSVEEEQIVEAALKFLNLSQHEEFVPDGRILEYKLAKLGYPLKINYPK